MLNSPVVFKNMALHENTFVGLRINFSVQRRNSWSILSTVEPAISFLESQNSLCFRIKLVLPCSVEEVEKS